MEVYVDPRGAALEGIGVTPDNDLGLYPANDLDLGHARAVSTLMRRLTRVQRPSPRRP